MLSDISKTFDPIELVITRYHFLGTVNAIVLGSKNFVGWSPPLRTCPRLFEVEIPIDIFQGSGLATIRFGWWIRGRNLVQSFLWWVRKGLCQFYSRCFQIISWQVEVILACCQNQGRPVKTQSVPTLEFCAALLGTRLYQSVIKSIDQMPVVIEETFAWTDSTIVLCWLSKELSLVNFCFKQISWTSKGKQFELEHVCSEENPGDPASRGINHDEINQHDVWWKGPKWLITGEFLKSLWTVEISEEFKINDNNNRNYQSSYLCGSQDTKKVF